MIFDKEKIDSIILHINENSQLISIYNKIFEIINKTNTPTSIIKEEFNKTNFDYKLHIYSAKLAEVVFESFVNENVSDDLELQLKIFDDFINIFNTILNKNIIKNQTLNKFLEKNNINNESVFLYHKDALFRYLAYLFYDRTNDKKQNIEPLIKHIIELNNDSNADNRYKNILFNTMKDRNRSFYMNKLIAYEKRYSVLSRHIIQLREGIKFLRGVSHDKEEIKRYITNYKFESKTNALNNLEEKIKKLKILRNDSIKEMRELDLIKIKECIKEIKTINELTREQFEEIMGHI